jgi:hypothetical protein
MITADRSKEFLILNQNPKTYHASSVVKSAFICVKGVRVRFQNSSMAGLTDPDVIALFLLSRRRSGGS